MWGPSLLQDVFRGRTRLAKFGRWWLVYAEAIEDNQANPLEWLPLVRSGGFDAIDRIYLELETIGG